MDFMTMGPTLRTKDGFGGTWLPRPSTYKEVMEEMESGSLQHCRAERQEAQVEMREFQAGYGQKPSPHEEGRSP